MEILELSPSLIRDVDTLLFDLDGTLVDMDKKFELPLMLRGIYRFRHFIAPWKFFSVFWSAVRAIQANDSDKTNFTVFFEYLLNHGKGTEEELTKIFDQIMNIDFVKSSKYFSETPGANETLELSKRLGFRHILATNPMFPLSAVKTRMKYGAGIDQFPFEYISHSQNSTRCKPKVAYYKELVDKLNLDPAKCLMIGNDPVKDLPAAELGIKTFLLKGEKYDRKIKKYNKYPHFLGTHAQLRTLLKESRL